MKLMITALFLLAPFTVSAQTNPEDLNRIYSPYIQGETLVIKGQIDSHIYDYFAREAKALKNVKYIELNSLGGHTEWALMVAGKIKDLGFETRVKSGDFCASACVYLFSAGNSRKIAADSWLGVHGVRLGMGYVTSFQGLCFIEMEDGSIFEPRKKGCQEFLDKWYAVTLKWTHQAFDFMESNGIDPALRATYFAMPDDPEWPEQLNVLRKPDWFMKSDEALKYRLATGIL